MFENLSTAIVQAFGFLIIFVFFIYQLLSEDKNTDNVQLKAFKKNSDKNKKLIEIPRNRGLFNRKSESKKDVIESEKKGWFK
tara:strand:- start:348 stop:593 length:246 start_codon:yes stop_codon:yes gene_type:complete